MSIQVSLPVLLVAVKADQSIPELSVQKKRFLALRLVKTRRTQFQLQRENERKEIKTNIQWHITLDLYSILDFIFVQIK